MLAPADQPLLEALLGAPGAAQRRAIAKAITLLESTRADHRARADELLNALLPRSGESFRLGISGVPGVGKSTFIEALGLFLIGARSSCGRARGRSVVEPIGWLDPRRQDAHGAAVAARARLHPPQPGERHAGRRGREDARGDAGLRGRRIRHRDRRDRGRRAERDGGGRHDRHVRADAVAQCRRRPAGDQEGRDGAGRPDRDQQGRSRRGRRDARAGPDRLRASPVQPARPPGRCAAGCQPVAPAGDAAQRARGDRPGRVLADRHAVSRVAGRRRAARRAPPCAGPGLDVGTHRSRPAPALQHPSGGARGTAADHCRGASRAACGVGGRAPPAAT